MIGEPTDITEIFQKYHDGKITWPEAREEILAFPFAKTPDEIRYGTDPFTSGFSPAGFYGTWDEVIYCRSLGLITEDEYKDLLS